MFLDSRIIKQPSNRATSRPSGKVNQTEISRGYEDLAPFAIYSVQKSANPLHVLVQGSYPDADSARAVQNRFPRKIQKKDRLWIRRFERVQALLE